MRFSLIALAGLLAFGDNLGVQARAAPDDLTLPTSLQERYVTTFQNDNLKRWLPEPPRTLNAPKAGAKAPSLVPHDAAPAGRVRLSRTGGAPTERLQSSGPHCVRVIKRSRIFKRTTTFTKADANDPEKILLWLSENEERLKTKEDITRDKLVFFASGEQDKGKIMAQEFVAQNPGYAIYDDIFLRSNFVKDFQGVYPERGPAAEAASKAFAIWATGEALVFYHDNAGSGSFLLKHELPYMSNVEKITKMQDDATKLTQTDGTLPVPQPC